MVLQLRDPSETTVRGAGFFRGQEAETGESFVTLGKRFMLNQEALHDQLKKAQIDHLLLQTDRKIEHTLRQFFQMRGLVGKGAR